MTPKQWSAWFLAAGIATLLTMVSIDLESGDTDTGTATISLANMTEAQKDSVVTTEIARAKSGDEIISLRKENSRTVKQGNGRFNAIISASPMNYLDKSDSIYKPIDLTVREISALAKVNPLRKFDKYVDAGLYRATWMDDKPHDYTLHKGDYFVTYNALFDTVDVPTKTVPQTNGVKQYYTFTESKKVQDLKWLISSNATVKKRDDGSITFSDDTGKSLFASPSPAAWDANYLPVLMNVTISGDTLIYTIDPPKETVYPIMVDPTIQITEEGVGDGFQSYHTTYTTARNVTSAGTGLAMYKISNYLVAPTDYIIQRTFFLFDVSGIGTTLSVSACSLYVYCTDDPNVTDVTISVIAGTEKPPESEAWFNDFVGWAASGAYSPVYYNQSTNTSTFTDNQWKALVFNATGCDSLSSRINAADTLRIAMITDEDIAGTAPTHDNGRLVLDDDINLPYLSFTYIIPTPSGFDLSSPSTSSIIATWTNTASYDSLLIMNSPENTAVVYVTPPSLETKTVGTLNPNTLYTFFIRASISGNKFNSNADSLYTLANPPNAWNFTGATTTSIAPAFGGNGNLAGTLYAIRDSTRSKWISATGDSASTKTWRTEAQWEAITITGLSIDTQYRFGVVGKNGDEVETAYLWGTVYTLIAVPGLPALTAISPFSIRFIIAPEDNPSYTQYALQDSITGLYADGSAEPETLRVGPPGDWGWKTFSQWGGVQGDTLTGLLPDSLYVLRVKARTGE